MGNAMGSEWPQHLVRVRLIVIVLPGGRVSGVSVSILRTWPPMLARALGLPAFSRPLPKDGRYSYLSQSHTCRTLKRPAPG